MPDQPQFLASGDPSTGAARQELLARLLRERASARPPEDYPLSYNQRSLWFLNRVDPDSAAYNVAYAWHVRSPLDREALRRAFLGLVARHAILRTVYGATEPTQKIQDPGTLDFIDIDARGWTDAERQRWLCGEARAPFDLHRGPVWRVRLLVADGADPVLLVAFHHIAYDLWSMVTMVDELFTLYASERDGVACQLPALPHQYVDFVRWQADLLARDGERLFAFWREYLAGDLPVLDLPGDYARPPVQSGSGATHARPLPPDVVTAALTLARSEQTTLFSVLLAAFQALLHRLSGQTQVVVGSPVAGRTHPEFENLIGYFLNTLPFRADASGDPSFRTFLARVRQAVHGVLKHQDYPLPELVTRLKPTRSAAHAPLFQSLFVLNRAHVRRELDLTSEALVVEPLSLDLESAQFDVSLEIEQGETAAIARWEYSTDLFEETTIAGWAAQFEALLLRATANPDLRLSELIVAGDRAPQSAAQAAVADIFADILKRDDLDSTASFVALGGTSFQALQVVRRLAQLAGVELAPGTFFELGTIERVAAWLEATLMTQLDPHTDV